MGEAIPAGGLTGVDAFPLTWDGAAYGALDVFHTTNLADPDPGLRVAGRAFADVASLVIVAPHVDEVELGRRKRLALAGRTVIEQAKGVIAFREGIATDDAYVRWWSSPTPGD